MLVRKINCIDCGCEMESRSGNHKRCRACAKVSNIQNVLNRYYKGKDSRETEEPQSLVLKNGVEIVLNAFGKEIAYKEIYQ